MARNAPSRTLAPNLTLVLRGLGRLQHPSGPVFFVRDRQPQPKEIVLAQWKRTLFLRDEGLEARGWLIEVMNCVESIGKQEFQLDDVCSLPIDSTQFMTSMSQPLASSPSSRRKSVLFHWASTISLGWGCRSRTKKTFPDFGIWSRRMLQPTQPARLAVAARGFRSSITSGTKNCFGTTNRFVTPKLF